MQLSDSPRVSGFSDHFISKLGLELSFDGTSCRGTAPVLPQSFAPGTRRIRTGYLATLADVVAGHAPNGAVGPTIDLRIQVFSSPPSEGELHLVSRPLRVGSRLIVGDTMLHAGQDPVPFARVVTTFMNVRLGVDLPAGRRPAEPMAEASFDDFLGARIRDAASLELEPVMRLANGIQGTVQGGAQALLAELAAEHVLGADHVPGARHALGASRRMVASDLDIRYLARLRIGPLVATAEEVFADDGQRRAFVTLTDGADGRLVGRVALTMVR